MSRASLAPLKNVTLFMQMLEKIINRDPNLPGFGAFFGPSGFGKTFASVYAANKTGAIYIEADDTWTKRILAQNIAQELGVATAGTVAESVDIIIKTLGEDPKPLIIDEADFLLKKQIIETVRAIHQKAQVPVILVGEDLLPKKLERWERIHNRVLVWQQAMSVDIDDARSLIQFYAPNTSIKDDLLAKIIEKTKANLRRVCVNLQHVKEFALSNNLKEVGLKEWGNQPIWTNETPALRRRVN